ncbi:MAG: hypothetical protein ACP5I4_04660 [Oceanipulchritudo sp.]
MKDPKVWFLLAGMALAGFLDATVQVGFERPAELGSQFAGMDGASPFTQSETGGAGSGSVGLTGTSQAAVYQSGFDATALSGAVFSIDFLYNGAGISGGPLMTGFTADSTDIYGSSTGTSGVDLMISFRKGADDSSNAVSLYNDGVEADSASPGAMVSGQCYRLELVIGGVSGGDFTGVVGYLKSIDAATGLETGTLATLDAGGVPHILTSSLTTDADVYGFFGGQNPSDRGVAAIDNLVSRAGPGALAVDFDDGSELVADFAGLDGTTPFEQVSTGGVIGTGSVTLNSTSQIAVYQKGFDGSAISGQILSLDFQYSGAGTSGGPLMTGITAGATDVYSSSTGAGGGVDLIISFRKNTGDSANLVSLYNDGTQVDSAGTGGAAMVPGQWYRLELEIGGVSGGDYTGVVGRLYSLAGIPAVIATLDSGGSPHTVTTALTADSEVFGFFGGQNPSTRGVAAVDNFQTGGMAATLVETLYDFNGSSTSLTDNFAVNTGSAVWNTSGGIADSGNTTYGTGNAMVVANSSFDGGSESITVSCFFQASDPFDAGGARILAIGFTSDSTDGYSSSATTTGTDLRLVLNRGTHPDYGIQILNNGVLVNASANNVTLTAGAWYYLELGINSTSGGDYTGLYGQLREATADGQIGSLLKVIDNSGVGFAATSSLTGDSTVYPFFGGQSSTAPIARIDNFTVTAEAGGAVEPPIPTLTVTGVSGGQLQISCPSETGFSYQLKSSNGLSGFANDGVAQDGTGGDLLFTPAAPASGAKTFHLVEVTPK